MFWRYRVLGLRIYFVEFDFLDELRWGLSYLISLMVHFALFQHTSLWFIVQFQLISIYITPSHVLYFMFYILRFAYFIIEVQQFPQRESTGGNLQHNWAQSGF